jgi:uncharacterized protein YndB with AHSA1/START domain
MTGRICIERVFAHPVAAVWRLLTTPDLHAKWWAAGDVRPIVGHAFTLDMGPKWGKQPCTVIEVVPERRLRYLFATTSLKTTITWELVPEGAGTRLTLIHEGFDLDSPLGRLALEGMGKGWPGIVARIDEVLRGVVGAEAEPRA